MTLSSSCFCAIALFESYCGCNLPFIVIIALISVFVFKMIPALSSCSLGHTLEE